ncbi:MAG: hypothetical protein QOG29_698 [Gaiellaceae bacterium]|nr:hypothetical protein [Gaiellaceae bacterium]MDX6478111.1 hypothetical protein [Gaiellaceae bacterium]MDX6483834.1 hypothetical protein [Gaiellaceae bacterium]MDX6489467.1 hypothetical protein [Gaiellaceae bacterium]MDX6510343.1 hypothetical protein [Gaiellaceae bacterium]
MGLLGLIVFGFLAGLVARLVTPGNQRYGCLVTICVGIVGAFLGGVIGKVVLGHSVTARWDLVPFLFAVAGAVILLLVLEALGGRRRRF